MNKIESFDTTKLFKEFKELWVLNKKYCRTEKRNVTERLPLPDGIFINK